MAGSHNDMTRRAAALLVVSLAAAPSAIAQLAAKPFFYDPELLPPEFEFDLGPTQTFIREFAPGSKRIAKPPATLEIEFQIEDARRDPKFPQFPASVSFWLISADEASTARIQIADDPRAETLMFQVKRIDQRTGKQESLLVGVTRMKPRAESRIGMVIDSGGAMKLRIGAEESRVDLGFAPVRLGAGAMGAKGWIRFVGEPTIS